MMTIKTIGLRTQDPINVSQLRFTYARKEYLLSHEALLSARRRLDYAIEDAEELDKVEITEEVINKLIAALEIDFDALNERRSSAIKDMFIKQRAFMDAAKVQMLSQIDQETFDNLYNAETNGRIGEVLDMIGRNVW